MREEGIYCRRCIAVKEQQEEQVITKSDVGLLSDVLGGLNGKSQSMGY